MENDPTLFPGEGTSVSIEGNNPFLIGDPGSVWLVDGGKIVLFLVSVRDQEVTGRRLYLLELSSGEVFFGIEPLENGNRYAILATGWTGTHLRQ
ncbi:MAG: NHLP bacteriocin export ABC transporter permease/ATPase subunit, partial [Atribacterota bacterium]